MKVLVTGGAGYLGCHLVRLLLDEGCSVRVLDRLCFGVAPLDKLANSSLEVVEGDIRRVHQCEGIFDGVDAIVHLAGIANDPSCALNAEMAADVNVESTKELARLAAHAGVRRFVLASSCAVYGRGLFDLLDEETPPNPVSPLGESKLAAEQALLSIDGGHFEPVIARCATLYGTSPRMRFDLAINLMVADALRDGRIIVRGGGHQWRPFLHVADAARGYWELLKAPAVKVRGQVFNLGVTEQNMRIGDLARLVVKKLDSGIEAEIPVDDADARTFRVSCARFEAAFDFKATHTIEEGIL